MKKVCAAIFVISQLTSCASYQEDFECQAGKGVGCKSISEVNDMVNRGEVASKTIQDATAQEPVTTFAYSDNQSFAKGKIYRAPEKTARIWIKSFTDNKGDHIGETFVHTVISPGSWKEGLSE
jgi:hypothetical protein